MKKVEERRNMSHNRGAYPRVKEEAGKKRQKRIQF